MDSLPRKTIKKDPVNGEQNDGSSCSGPSDPIDSSSSSSNNNNSNGSVNNIGQPSRHMTDVKDLLAPPEQDSPSHILMALNDHCLYEVFKWLHFLDLANVAKVCKKFQCQAKEAFSSKYKHLELNRKECDQNKMEDVLCEFGSSIQSLDIDSDKHAADGALFGAIIQNCKSQLKGLQLFNMNIQVDSPDARLPFPKLEELELKICVGNISLAHLIDDCPELKQINLFDCSLQGLNGFISRKFEKLEEISIVEEIDCISDAALEQFISTSPTLKTFRIASFGGLQTSRSIRLIGQNLLALKALLFSVKIDNLEQFQNDLQSIGNLCSLKELSLNFNGLKVTPLANVLVANNLPIECLGIKYAQLDDIAINLISQLKEINRLDMHVVRGMKDDNVIRLARNLPKLQEWTVIAAFGVFTIDGIIQMLRYAKKLSKFKLVLLREASKMTINLDDYNIMMDMIRNRSEKNSLRFVYGGKIELNVPENILQTNRDILSIELFEYD